jgi:hypothetical protein
MTVLNPDTTGEIRIGPVTNIVDIKGYCYTEDGDPAWLTVVIPTHESQPDVPEGYDGKTVLLVTWDRTGYTVKPFFPQMAVPKVDKESGEEA